MKCLGIERVTWSGKVTSMLHLSKDEPFPKYKKRIHILPKKKVYKHNNRTGKIIHHISLAYLKYKLLKKWKMDRCF